MSPEDFRQRFGREPSADELHRVTCDRAGEFGHRPRFECGCLAARFECGSLSIRYVLTPCLVGALPTERLSNEDLDVLERGLHGQPIPAEHPLATDQRAFLLRVLSELRCWRSGQLVRD